MPRRKTWRNCLRARNELLGVFILICVDRVTKISCINAHASTLSNVSLLSHLDKCALQCSATSGNNVFPFRHPLVRCGQFSLIRRNISSDICNKYLLQAQNVVTAGELVEIQLNFDKYQYWNQAELDFRILCCRSHSISEFKNRLIHLIDSKYFLFALIWWIPVRLYLYFENARLPDPGSCQKNMEDDHYVFVSMAIKRNGDVANEIEIQPMEAEKPRKRSWTQRGNYDWSQLRMEVWTQLSKRQSSISKSKTKFAILISSLKSVNL